MIHCHYKMTTIPYTSYHHHTRRSHYINDPLPLKDDNHPLYQLPSSYQTSTLTFCIPFSSLATAKCCLLADGSNEHSSSFWYFSNHASLFMQCCIRLLVLMNRSALQSGNSARPTNSNA